MNKKVKIGFPMEYEDDKHIIRTGLWLKEYEVEMLEKKLNEYNNLQSKIDKISEFVDKIYDVMDYRDYPPYLDEIYYTLHPELKENK